MVMDMLSQIGFSVTTACDGQEALEQADLVKFDLIISDINMPRLDGIELVKALRNLPNYKFTPILILTTEHSAEVKTKCKEAGATGWIIKPFNPEKLIQVIKRVIE